MILVSATTQQGRDGKPTAWMLYKGRQLCGATGGRCSPRVGRDGVAQRFGGRCAAGGISPVLLVPSELSVCTAGGFALYSLQRTCLAMEPSKRLLSTTRGRTANALDACANPRQPHHARGRY